MKPQPWDPVPHWLYSHVYETRADLMTAAGRLLMMLDQGIIASCLHGTREEAIEALRAARDAAKVPVAAPGPTQDHP